MVADRLVYCSPVAKDWDVPPGFTVCQHGAAANTGIKLSSAGTLAIFFSQKHDIALITPMTKLVILEYPDPRLRKQAAPVPVVDDALRQLVDDMLETMYGARGVGLAATQVDVHKRLIVLDISDTRDQSRASEGRGLRPRRRGLPIAARHLRQVDARNSYSRAGTGP